MLKTSMESHGITTFLLKRSLPKKSLARTCFLAKKQCAPPKAVLRIRLEKWGEISGTRFARPTFWLLKNRLVRLWCCNCTLCANLFRAETERMNQPRHRLAEPRRTPKKNVPCFSDLRATNFF